MKINYEEQDLVDTFMGRDHTRWAPGQYESGYHNDWNYLMPVVEKISEMEEEMKDHADEPAVRNFFELAIFTSMPVVYESVVKFIKWFNTQHPNPNT